MGGKTNQTVEEITNIEVNYQSHHGIPGHAEVLAKSAYSLLKDVVIEKHREGQSIDDHSNDADQS